MLYNHNEFPHNILFVYTMEIVVQLILFGTYTKILFFL